MLSQHRLCRRLVIRSRSLCLLIGHPISILSAKLVTVIEITLLRVKVVGRQCEEHVCIYGCFKMDEKCLKPGQKRQKSIAELFKKPIKTSKTSGDTANLTVGVLSSSDVSNSSVIDSSTETQSELSAVAAPPSDINLNAPSVVKLPKASTLSKWKTDFDWLVITDRNTIICKTCASQGEKLILKNPCRSLEFISGATNFKRSALFEHGKSRCHLDAIEEAKHEQAEKSGETLPPKQVKLDIPKNSIIAVGIRKMSENERAGLKKLFDIAHYIAVKGRPFTDFEDLIELEKSHGVKFDTSSYENESACREFIKSIATYLFDIDIREKLLKVDFIAILID